MIEVVHIPKYEYDSLCQDSMKLRALEAAGVDNWEGYSEAVSTYEGEADELL